MTRAAEVVLEILRIFDNTIELYSSALEIKELSISAQVDARFKANFDLAMIRTAKG